MDNDHNSPGPSGHQSSWRNQNTENKKQIHQNWRTNEENKESPENTQYKTQQVGFRSNYGRFKQTSNSSSSIGRNKHYYGPRPNHYKRTTRVNFQFLEKLTNLNNEDIIKNLEENKEGFLKLLQEPFETHDSFVVLIEIMLKLTKTSFDKMATKILVEICNSNFVAFLRNYLMDLPDQSNRKLNKLYWDDPKKFWENFLTLFEYIVDLLPSIALLKCKPMIDTTITQSLDKLHSAHGFILTDEYNLKFKKMQQRLALYEASNKSETKKTNFEDTLEPPESFRLLSILPTTEDIIDSRPFLRKNIIEGGYRDIEHYMDVQFRLLREDCYGPLRDGINQYLTDKNSRQYDNIRVYRSVKFDATYISDSSYKSGYIIQIDPTLCKRFVNTRWNQNKRFLHGALLSLTKDNCRSFIFATVLDRDIEMLKLGKIPVSVYGMVVGSELLQGESYVMFESETYFEPYYHVLNALQNPTFPKQMESMSKYIVKTEPEPKAPAYLDDQSEYSLRINEEIIKFTVLREKTWPTEVEMGLNHSQYIAYKMALTHEFAVIQGPPGTGKTFLGVKVARTLLENYKALINARIALNNEKRTRTREPLCKNQSCIMLLVCYTNHALDQFLEAILPVTDSIVRFGGQSRNEKLTTYNINYLRRHCSGLESYIHYDLKRELASAVSIIRSTHKTIDLISQNVIIDFRTIKKHVPESRVLDSLQQQARNEDPLKYWLFKDIKKTQVNYNEMVSHIEEYQINDHSHVNCKKDNFYNYFDDVELEYETDTIGPDIKVICSLDKDTKFLKLVMEELANCFDTHERTEIEETMTQVMKQIKISKEMFKYRNRRTKIELQLTNVNNIKTIDRWSLYFKWARIVQNDYKEEVKELQENLQQEIETYEESRMVEDLRLLRSKNIEVVGMTTSGAARVRKLLQELCPPIVIVEEAAEVLEAHIVTSLNENCQHLILIGDHQQLRPSASYMKLARRYNIEVSLFERMILNGVHSCRLDVQHRMRPEIAALISPHIYKHLENHPHVQTFPDVRGVTKNLFFLSHDYIEEQADENSTRTNINEADVTLAFANYLMQQGYSSEDITILTTYTGQMFYMRNISKSFARLEGVKITVVDNYQGEESKIILLSLVRNNAEGKIGFLGINNRICVALSRAREGFYMFGNIDILRKNELWNNIAVTLERNQSIGKSLTLRCENHKDQITVVSSLDHFKNVPEGGCLEKCNSKLSKCGHPCTFLCHGYDREHEKLDCTFKCERVLCDKGHVCPLKCSINCGICKVLVEKILPCGHSAKVPCYQDPEEVRCMTLERYMIPHCGHTIEKACFISKENARCTKMCEIRVERCGHSCTRFCHVLDDPHHDKYECQKPCPREKRGCSAGLESDRGEHQCDKLCYEECDPCVVEVSKKRSTCKHAEVVPCYVDVNLIECMKNCTRALNCGHFCKKKCHEACGDCLQLVKKPIPDCGHEVSIKCGLEPQRAHCEQNCQRLLKCGHTCKGLCAVPCDLSRCEAPLEETMLSSCGHSVPIPCNLATSLKEGSITSDEVRDMLSRLCTSPCGAKLLCEHECSGTCSECRQGALHFACNKPCGATNICGHMCESPCNQVCPPCAKQCPVKCPHNRCGNLCGAPCKPCQEKCTRACVHSKCTRRCGERCSRAACSERCPKRLSCGHPCRGLCGEPCPDVCAICRPYSVPQDFILAPYEDDDIFIKLDDCPHIFSVVEVDLLVKKEEDVIKIPACPLCRVPIINTYRYKDIINDILKNEINPVKRKVYGDKEDIENAKSTFFHKIDKLTCQDMAGSLKHAVKFLAVRSKRFKRSTLLQLKTYLTKINIIEIINDLYKDYHRQKNTSFNTELKELIEAICEIVKDETCKLSEQRQMDINFELKRLNALINLAMITDTKNYNANKSDPEIANAMEQVRRHVFKRGVFDEVECLDAFRRIQDSQKYQKMERELVVRAMGTKMGHWYKCPNGHPYYIGECGGAMQVSKCIECGVSVGGSNHRLVANNAHAGEIDGSSFAAWSEQANNMNNFDLNDL